jgi:hypothetical protein
MPVHDISIHGKRSTPSARKTSRCSRREGKETILKDVPGMSNIKSKSRGGRSIKREVARILSATPGTISPCMQRSLVDR